MDSGWNSGLGIALFSLLVLAGCSGVDHTKDEAFWEAERALSAAQSDPRIREYGATVLANASDSLELAKSAQDIETLHHHAFMALKQVEVARALTEARQGEQTLIALAKENRYQVAESRRPAANTRTQVSQAKASQTQASEAQASRALGSQEQDSSGEQLAARTPTKESAQATRSAPFEPDHVPASRRLLSKAAVSDLEKQLFGSDEQFRPVLEAGGFERGGTDLSSEVEEKLGLLAKLLELEPRRQVTISGFADDGEGPLGNIWLSDARARAVKDYLVSRGIDAERIWTVGFGGATRFGSGDESVVNGVRITLRAIPRSVTPQAGSREGS